MTKHRDTRIVTAGRGPEFTHGIVNPPVFHASTVVFDTHDEMRERIKDVDGGLFYGRKGTTTHRALESAMMDLEGGVGCKTYSSGLAAITTAILSAVRSGDHLLVMDSCYEPTRDFCRVALRRMGVEATFFDPMVGADIKSLVQPNTKAVMLEVPGSLTFEIPDIPAIADVIHNCGGTVILDNTWATPILFNGFKHGADIVVHAATKYIVGHSDAMLGTAAANKKAWPSLRRLTYQLGHVAGPDDVYLGLRGLRTLAIRLRQHEENALQVARWLRARPEVDRVLHPAFEECPGHDIWLRDFRGATGLFSFVLNIGDYENIGILTDELEHFALGFSWGGFESLILPADPVPNRKVTTFEAPGPLVRLHIGIEDPGDLITDLEKGLERLKAAE